MEEGKETIFYLLAIIIFTYDIVTHRLHHCNLFYRYKLVFRQYIVHLYIEIATCGGKPLKYYWKLQTNPF